MTLTNKLNDLIANNKIDLIKKLLAYGLSPDSLVEIEGEENDYDCSLLEAAMHYGQSELFYILIKAGADLNVQNIEGLTFLMLAIEDNDIERAKLLIEAEANLELKDENNNTALVYAIAYELKEIEELIREKLKENKSLELLVKCTDNETKAAIQCIRDGADINFQDKHSHTPLMMTIARNNIGLSQKLINANADLNIQDDDGKTALDYAKEFGCEEIITLIKRKQLENEINENAKNRQEEK